MNNVVQNISIADIVPSDFQIQQDSNELKELAASIKKFGILEPILVRPLNGKYEIIIGNKRYVAAKMIGLSSVPALIKNVDDEVFKQYRMITKKEQRRSNEQKNDISQSSSNSPKKILC